MNSRRSTAPKKAAATPPPPPTPDTDLRVFEYEDMDRVVFQWMNAGRNAFIKIDGQHVYPLEDRA